MQRRAVGSDPTLEADEVSGRIEAGLVGQPTAVPAERAPRHIDGTTGESRFTYHFVDGTDTGDLAGISGTLRQSGPEITGTVRCQRTR